MDPFIQDAMAAAPDPADIILGDMTIQRMDNVGIVVEDLDAAVAFFTELGMELEGKAQVEGPWVDRTIGLDGVRRDIAMMRTPDGHSKLELTKYQAPAASGVRRTSPSAYRSIGGRPTPLSTSTSKPACP